MSCTYPEIPGYIVAIIYSQQIRKSSLGIYFILYYFIYQMWLFSHFYASSHFIASKKEYDRNSHSGKKAQVLVMTAQNKFSIIRHSKAHFLLV